jgi:hypothetical protein
MLENYGIVGLRKNDSDNHLGKPIKTKATSEEMAFLKSLFD